MAITLRLAPALEARAKQHASDLGVSLNALVAVSLDAYLRAGQFVPEPAAVAVPAAVPEPEPVPGADPAPSPVLSPAKPAQQPFRHPGAKKKLRR